MFCPKTTLLSLDKFFRFTPEKQRSMLRERVTKVAVREYILSRIAKLKKNVSLGFVASINTAVVHSLLPTSSTFQHTKTL
jgi:hypothetical protein